MQPFTGDIDPINSRMEAVQRALTSDTATVGRYGVSVRTRADGTLEHVQIDEVVTPYGGELGALIVELVGEALEQARDNAREQMAELAADPRITTVIETLGDAAEKPRPVASPMPSSTPKFVDPDDDLTEEELIELNERRNQSYFRSRE